MFVIGASGSGKDSLIARARRELERHSGIVFAHRYITRPSDAGGENHVALSGTEFRLRAQAGLFALRWQSHGLHYGIGIEIEHWLAQGLVVVVNGSRAYLPQAARRYPQLVPVWIEVSPAVLQQRLRHRGRESDAEIGQRLRRAAQFKVPLHPRPYRLNSDGSLDQSGKALADLILGQKTRSRERVSR